MEIAKILDSMKELSIEIYRCAGNNNADYHEQWARRLRTIHNDLVRCDNLATYCCDYWGRNYTDAKYCCDSRRDYLNAYNVHEIQILESL